MADEKEVTPYSWWSTKCIFISKYVLSYWFYIHIILFIPLAIIQLRFSTVYEDHCTMDNRIILYLLIIGIIQLIYSFNGILLIILSLSFNRYRYIPFFLVICFASEQILLIFLFIWFIIGNYLVFHIKDEVQYTNSYNIHTYCNYTLYQAAFWTIIIYHLFIIIFSLTLVVVNINWLIKQFQKLKEQNKTSSEV